LRERHGRGTQGRDKVPFALFVWSLVVHALSPSGSLGHHVRTMSRVSISDAAAHERRQGLTWEWFKALFALLLKPLAERKHHPESFYRGMRLLGVDGTSWSLRHTASVIRAAGPLHRSGAKRKPAGFFKWGAAVLVELGVHQPLDVACATLEKKKKQEGEMTIARRVVGGIPTEEEILLLADRYYGRGAFLAYVQEIAGALCQMLIRIPSNQKAKVIEVLPDGSARVEVRVCHLESRRLKTVLTLREVRGKVWRKGSSKPTTVRLWTTLLDAELYPATELLALYCQRWEQELFFRELKAHTAREQLLRAGSPQGAEAEFGAMIIAASLLARERLAAARQVGLPPLRLSIAKIRIALSAVLPVLSIAGDLLTPRQRQKIIQRFMAHAAREARIPPRRSRSCQRGLRKPQCSWPCIRSRQTLDASIVYDVIPTTFP
jgi:hypothetical protein